MQLQYSYNTVVQKCTCSLHTYKSVLLFHKGTEKQFFLLFFSKMNVQKKMNENVQCTAALDQKASDRSVNCQGQFFFLLPGSVNISSRVILITEPCHLAMPSNHPVHSGEYIPTLQKHSKHLSNHIPHPAPHTTVPLLLLNDD